MAIGVPVYGGVVMVLLQSMHAHAYMVYSGCTVDYTVHNTEHALYVKAPNPPANPNKETWIHCSAIPRPKQSIQEVSQIGRLQVFCYEGESLFPESPHVPCSVDAQLQCLHTFLSPKECLVHIRLLRNLDSIRRHNTTSWKSTSRL